ncbi:MAG: hypothetical protein ACO1Q7_16735 [Gemmatimonas sp.]
MPTRRIPAKTPRLTSHLPGGAMLLNAEQRPVRGRGVHRHQLALLAQLGRTRPTAVWRDRFIGLLWPERHSAMARHLFRLASLAGECEAAVGRVLPLWKDCDAELRPTVDDAQRKLSALQAPSHP